MSTKQARTRATAAWRARTGAKLVQAYLHTDIIEKLDKLVLDRGATGRAAVLADLIREASQHQEPDTEPAPETDQEPDREVLRVLMVPNPGVPEKKTDTEPAPKTPKRWKLSKSRDQEWPWDLSVDGKLVGWIKPPEKRGARWVGSLARSPGAENYRYRRTRGELAELLAVLVIDG